MFFRPNCLFCGCQPCSVDASCCPHCGHDNPNPGVGTRISSIVCSLLAVLSLGIPAGVFASIGWGMHPRIGLAVAGCFLLWAALYMARAVWYAVDPTLSILPRPHGGH